MSEIPDDIRPKLIKEVYRQADILDWDGLTARQRTDAYDRWLDDPEIGTILKNYLPRERARVWLKDGLMKEYSRARTGIGPYAGMVSSRLPGPEQIAKQILGEGWQVVAATVRQKPNRCTVQSGDEERTMIWGAASALRDLIWAGINSVADDLPRPLLVVTVVGGNKLTEGEKQRHLSLGGVAGLQVVHTTLRAIRER